jgi:four helix bundle protein
MSASNHNTFESLRVWHEARQLTARVYKVTRVSGLASDFGLCDQLRRSAVSVMSNIAEGHERGSNPEFRRFLGIAKGSCGELRSQLYTAEDVGYLEHDVAADLRTCTLRLSRTIQALAQHRARATPR